MYEHPCKTCDWPTMVKVIAQMQDAYGDPEALAALQAKVAVCKKDHVDSKPQKITFCPVNLLDEFVKLKNNVKIK